MTADRNIGIMLGMYFNCFVAIGVFDLGKNLSYIPVSGLGFLTVAYAFYVHGWNVRSDHLMRWLMLTGLFAGIVGVSYLINFNEYRLALTFKAIGYFSVYFVASGVALAGGWRPVHHCLKVYWLGLLASIVITMAINNCNPHNHRLHGPFKKHNVTTSGLHANEVGQIGMTAVLAAATVGWPAVLLTAPVGFYVALMSGSRGSMIAIFIAMATYFVAREFLAKFRNRPAYYVPRRGLQLASILFVLLCVAGVFIGPTIAEKVLLLNDPRRGLSSGLTGRSEQWAALWEHWLRSPVFGRGYAIVRAEVQSVGGHADGGFLLVMAELGVIGLLFFLGLFAGAIKTCFTAVARTGSANELTFFVFLCAFCFINLFESRIVGAGSMGLGMFFYCVSLCLIRPQTSEAQAA